MNVKMEFSAHARFQMIERGANEEEVKMSILQGESEIAKKGRKIYRKNFQFTGKWRGKTYRIKQVAPVVVEEREKIIVVTVYVFYF